MADSGTFEDVIVIVGVEDDDHLTGAWALERRRRERDVPIAAIRKCREQRRTPVSATSGTPAL
jgi:hypothetical protein